MNTYQALRVLNVSSDSTQAEIRVAYRRMALELHPDKNSGDDGEFKKVTEAYNHLKSNHYNGGGGRNDDGGSGRGWEGNGAASRDGGRNASHGQHGPSAGPDMKSRKRSQWGAGPQDGTIPEQDWGRFTTHVEEEDPGFWKEYERKFWEDYNTRITAGGSNGEHAKAAEPGRRPNIFVEVDKSLCIGCCSCEIIAPDVFEINKKSMMNPKSSVINQRGAGINKIMNAAETCPTKAIMVDNLDTKERLFPY